MVQYLTAATLDHGNHDVNPWFSTLLQHPWIKKIMIETHGSEHYCSKPRSRISLLKPMVQYLTAATFDHGNHDRNSWISTLLQHHWTKKIIIETLGLIPYCSILRSRSKEIIIETLGSVPYFSNLNQGNHDRNPCFSTLLQQPLIKEIMIETHGSIPYCSNPRSRIS